MLQDLLAVSLALLPLPILRLELGLLLCLNAGRNLMPGSNRQAQAEQLGTCAWGERALTTSSCAAHVATALRQFSCCNGRELERDACGGASCLHTAL